LFLQRAAFDSQHLQVPALFPAMRFSQSFRSLVLSQIIFEEIMFIFEFKIKDGIKSAKKQRKWRALFRTTLLILYPFTDFSSKERTEYSFQPRNQINDSLVRLLRSQLVKGWLVTFSNATSQRIKSFSHTTTRIGRLNQALQFHYSTFSLFYIL
jgi:hypothetical protein